YASIGLLSELGNKYSLFALRLRSTLRTSGFRAPFVLSVTRRVKSKHERHYPQMNWETYRNCCSRARRYWRSPFFSVGVSSLLFFSSAPFSLFPFSPLQYRPPQWPW